MNLTWSLILLPVGLLLLIKSADVLVEGAVAIAERFGVSPLIVGLTVVAMGTSAPEVATSITAAARDNGAAALGNVYGSNIANLALVGGICALIRPINVTTGMLRREMPVMVLVALLLWPILHDVNLSRPDSAVLLTIFVILILFTVWTALRDTRQRPLESARVDAQVKSRRSYRQSGTGTGTGRSVVFVLSGLIGLTVGANLTVLSAEFLGRLAGLSDAVIGITILAVGTSLPELVTCVVAAVKGHDDISIGNLVGSNVFNTLLVVGAAGSIKPFAVNPRFIGTDYGVMIAVSVAFFVIAFFRKRIGRVAGAALLTSYAAYMVYLLIYTPGL